MQLPPITCDQIRQIDQVAIERYHIPGIVLMENAGRGAAEAITRVASPGRILILCGKGNNGGDGFTIARHLQSAGWEVMIWTVAPIDQLSGDAAIQARIADASGISITLIDNTCELASLPAANVIVDALVGTGAKPPLRGTVASLVQLANATNAMRIALDIPSGMNGDTGEVSEPTFRASRTLTFAASKIGFQQPTAQPWLGTVEVISIGVPLKLLQSIQS